MSFDESDVRAVVLRINPFWGYILARTRFKLVEGGYPSSFTDGKNIVVLREQAKDIKTAVQITLHELAHIAYLHVLRRKEDYEKVLGEKVHPFIANLGEDVVANAIVYDITKKHIPKAAVLVKGSGSKEAVIRLGSAQFRVVFPRPIRELTTEEIIREILKQLPQEVMEEIEKGGGTGEYWNDDHSKHGELSEAEKDEIRHKIRKAVEEAKKLRGDVPAGIEELIEAAKPKVRYDWRTYARKWIWETYGRDDYTWKRPNKKKMAATRIYLPRTVGRSGEIFVVLDTSGSMGEKELSEALGVIQASAIVSGVKYANILNVDADVEKVDRVSVYRLKRYKVKGRGGTVLWKGVEKAVEMGAKGVVVITDGFIDEESFEQAKIPILIVITRKGNEKLRIENPMVKVVKMK